MSRRISPVVLCDRPHEARIFVIKNRLRTHTIHSSERYMLVKIIVTLWFLFIYHNLKRTSNLLESIR